MTTGLRCWVRRCSLLFTAALGISCGESPAPQVRATIGQWIWTRTDLARFSESRAQQPGLEAAVFIGYIQCDTISKRLLAHAGLSASEPHAESVTAVIRFEDGLERCRVAASSEADFAQRLDSAVYLLRRRARSVRWQRFSWTTMRPVVRLGNGRRQWSNCSVTRCEATRCG